MLLHCKLHEMKTYFRLVVQRISSFRPRGGFAFNKTNKACRVIFEYRGPIAP